MASESDRIYSEFIDAWNAGERPDVDDYLRRAPEAEREELASELMSFMSFAPSPAYSEQTLSEIRAEPVVAATLDAATERSGLLPALLRRARERLGLSTEQLAGELVSTLGLGEERRPKTASYLERWERGELASARVSQRVFDGLARCLSISSRDLVAAADAGGPAASTVFRADAAAPAAAPMLNVLADAIETPSAARSDEIDDLFLGGR